MGAGRQAPKHAVLTSFPPCQIACSRVRIQVTGTKSHFLQAFCQLEEALHCRRSGRRGSQQPAQLVHQGERTTDLGHAGAKCSGRPAEGLQRGAERAAAPARQLAAAAAALAGHARGG